MAGKSYGPGDRGEPRSYRPAAPEHDDFRTYLRGLPGDIARVKADTGEPFVVELPAVPDPHIARLLATLGVSWTVATVTVTAEQVTVRCSLGCVWSFDGEREEAVESALWHREQVHGVAAPSSGRLPLNGGYGFTIEGGTVNGLDALKRMDAGEAQRPVGEGEPRGGDAPGTASSAGHSAATSDAASTVSSPSPNGRSKWTRETIIAAIKEYAAEHGHAPSSSRPPGKAIYIAARGRGLDWSTLVAEAGTVLSPTGAAARAQSSPPPRQTGGRSAALKPVPVAASEPAVAPPLTLADAAAALEAANEELERAQEIYEDALEAFRSHEVVQQIKNERGF